MTLKKQYLFFGLLMFQFVLGQNDTISRINEVVVSDTQLKNFSSSQSVSVLNDSIIHKNQSSLTALLNYNSVIYFKENGLGMVSSVSFRGTTAQQTAVIWNGININSVLNGQSDFNTINSRDYENIAIRAGGGSSIYGSSAIGGSIHLNNELKFGNLFRNELLINYGSFNTLGTNYKVNVSNQKVSTQISLSRNSSDNDYEYIGTKDQKNENGQFDNTSMNVSFGYQLNKNHVFKLYSQFFESKRHFSGTLASKSKSMNQDFNTRNLVEWDAFFNRLTSKFKIAFVSEKYQYFENAKTTNFESAKAETLIAKHDLNFDFNSKIVVNTILEYSQTKGIGDQIGENIRTIGSATLLFKHRVFEKLAYDLSCRKEITSNYDSPVLFAFGTQYTITKNYNLLFNLSRNFRIPTFNDLYWKGLGNINLKPENSYQGEIGQHLKFKNIFISGTVYYMKISDLIQWKPNPDNGNWNPINVADVTSYGAEILLKWNKIVGNHHYNIQENYGYSVSKDTNTNYQLIYVPFHKFNTTLAYSYKKIAVNYQFLYNGFVYTSTDNFYFLKGYQVSNFGIDYDFGKKTIYKFGFQILNLWNKDYQSVAQRPLPGRNYSLFLNFKF